MNSTNDQNTKEQMDERQRIMFERENIRVNTANEKEFHSTFKQMERKNVYKRHYEMNKNSSNLLDNVDFEEWYKKNAPTYKPEMFFIPPENQKDNNNKLLLVCKLQGGIGNQLFQFFAMMNVALEFNLEVDFLDMNDLPQRKMNERLFFKIKEHHDFHSRKIDLNHLDSTTTKIMENYVEGSFSYNSLVEVVKKNQQQIKVEQEKDKKNTNIDIFLITFLGYFQSPKYFESRFDQIFSYLELNIKQEQVQAALKEMIPSIDDSFWETTVGLHFRLGDYKNLPQYHPLIKIDYYIDALRLIFAKDTNIRTVLFTYENEDKHVVNETVELLKKIFNQQVPPSLPHKITFLALPELLATAYQEKEDWKELFALSCCAHQIIANSTFSWWAAYFNSNPNKIVCYPSPWFGNYLSYHNTDDLFPDSWNKITWN